MNTKEERDQMAREAAEAMKKSRQEKDRKKNAYSGGNRTFEKIEYVALDYNSDVLVRFVGDMFPFRREPSSMKQVIYSDKVLDDNGKFMKVCWSEDKNWFLWKFYNLIMACDWKDQEKIPRYKKVMPEIYNMVAKNNSTNPYENGWQPSNFLVCNVIDRKDIDWHKQNKHTKVLTKRITVSNEVAYPQIGIPISLYEMLCSDVVEFQGALSDYDVIIRKTESKPFYQVRHSIIDAVKLKKENPELLNLSNNDPMTEEEMSWVRYDFDKIYKVTSYQKIMNRLGQTIKKVDAKLNKKMYEELEELCAKEKAEYAAKNETVDSGNEDNSNNNNESTTTNINTKVEPSFDDTNTKPSTTAATTTENKVESSEPKETRKVRPTDNKLVNEINWAELSEIGLKGIEKMTDDEKKLVIEFNDQGEFTYNYDKTKIFDCQVCGFPAPDVFAHCPNCARKFNS
jgi:hypothetical protein